MRKDLMYFIEFKDNYSDPMYILFRSVAPLDIFSVTFWSFRMKDNGGQGSKHVDSVTILT